MEMIEAVPAVPNATPRAAGIGLAIPTTMRAVMLRQFGGPEVLRVEEVRVPEPAAGEVLLRVGAVSINRSFDLKVREDGNGRPVKLPVVLGTDPAGEVVAVGPGVEDYRLGDRVAVWRTSSCGACERCQSEMEDTCRQGERLGVQRWGGDAEYVAVPTSMLARVPETLNYADATVIIRHFPMALALAFDRAGLRAGESALVMGAAGGLGSALVQVVHWAGSRVLAGAGADERVQFALDLGAEAGVNYRTEDLAERARSFSGGKGVDVVFENIGDPTLWPAAFNSLRFEGRLATVGSHGGGTVPLDARRLYGQHLSVLGGAHPLKRHVQQSLEGAAEGHFRTVIREILPLDQVARAHELAASGSVVGKILLDPNGLATA